MSIYIHGIDMPTKQLLAVINPDGLVEILNSDNILIEEFQATQVPPHGRLIDADEMRDEWLINGENEYVYDTNAFLESIDNQPTVISAELGGAEGK